MDGRTFLKAPIGDLLFGTLGLVIGLIVAFFLGSAINNIAISGIGSIVPVLLSIVLRIFRIPSWV